MLPLCPFPTLHWMALAFAEGETELTIHENYIKQTYRNRYDILAVNGVLTLTIPVEGQKGNKVMIKDIRIANQEWRKLHLGSIRSAYGRAAYFEFYQEEITSLFERKNEFLIDFNLSTLEWIAGCLPGFHFKKSNEIKPFNELSEEEKSTLLRFEPASTWPETPPYLQVFADRFPFTGNLSVLDLIMNKGPKASDYLLFTKNGQQGSDPAAGA